MKKVPSVYTHSMNTIYLSLSAQVAEGPFLGTILYCTDTSTFIDDVVHKYMKILKY